MNLRRRGAGRPDDWPSSHVRARSDLSDRLDGALEPGESALARRPPCGLRRVPVDGGCLRGTAPRAARAARADAAAPARPVGPDRGRDRDEASFRDGRRLAAPRRSRSFAPTALLAAALVVAVAVGTLTSSRWFGGDGTARASPEMRSRPRPEPPRPRPSAARPRSRSRARSSTSPAGRRPHDAGHERRRGLPEGIGPSV